ncbi:NAD(P)H-hydrate epimerase [Calidifontibacter terrae]
MIRAYGIDDVRTAERSAMADLPEGELMRRAADGLAQVLLARLDEGERVVVLAGSGDNGGDALYAAATTCEVANVVVVQTGSTVHEEGLAAAVAAGAIALEWREGEPSEEVATALGEADLVVDGVLGIGGRPGLPPHLTKLAELIDPEAYVVAVDLPSGIDPNGLRAGDAIYADETVTFALAKPGHLSPAGEPATGLLTVVDIGVAEPQQPAFARIVVTDVPDLWPIPMAYDDKYSRGVLGVMTGSETYPGAAVLGVTAAVTAGVGMVRYVGPRRAADMVLNHVPEVVTGPGKVQAWLLGSGWDGHGGAADLVDEILQGDLPVVLDAGALALIDEPRSAPTVLTPHAGELRTLMERLDLPGEPDVVGARAVADALDVVVLLKGAVTVVVPPTDSGEPVMSQADGSAWLATAGSGDVLAGVIGSLAACGLDLRTAGALGAFVHGRAADVANPDGPVRALDVARAIGPTVAGLLRG